MPQCLPSAGLLESGRKRSWVSRSTTQAIYRAASQTMVEFHRESPLCPFSAPASYHRALFSLPRTGHLTVCGTRLVAATLHSSLSNFIFAVHWVLPALPSLV